MSHMQPDITEKQCGWMVETRQGTFYVPESVQSIPDWLTFNCAVTESDDVFDMLSYMVRAYVEGEIIQIEAIGEHYFARLSAPGYLDSTEWCAFETKKEAREYLRDL